jgi:hypothetical protein
MQRKNGVLAKQFVGAFVVASAICVGAAALAVSDFVRREAPIPTRSSDAGLMLTRSEAIADEHYLLATLSAVHPGPYAGRSMQRVPSAARIIERNLPSQVTRVELFRALAPLIGSLGDGHTSIYPYLPEYAAYRDGGGRLFPLELDCAGSEPVVVADFDQPSRIPPGAVLVAIGHRRASDVIQRISRYDTGDTAMARRFNACVDVRPLAWIDGDVPPYDLHYRLPGSMRFRHAVVAGATIDSVHRWDATAEGRRRLEDYAFRLVDGGSIGILTMHTFDDPTAFAGVAADMFRKLHLSGSASLLVDIRENSGGNLALAKTLLDGIAAHSYRLVSREETKVSRLVKTTLGAQKYRDVYGATAWKTPDGTILRAQFARQPPDRRQPRFQGNVFVLVGSGTFSSAAMFAAAIQDARAGTILGSPSGGNATLYGERFDFTLPASGLNVSVPTKFFVRPNGDPRIGGVTPDQRLDPTAQVDPVDTELAAALAFVRLSSRVPTR